jgi:hypothetical protein
MKAFVHLFAAAATLCLATGSSNALPINTNGTLKGASDATGLVHRAAVYIVEGHQYCFYFDGWHGPGWYRCGYSWRRGLGWGGVYGWRGWEYGPAQRRFGHGHFTVREGRDRDHYTREGRDHMREHHRDRSGVTVHEESRGRGRSGSNATVNEGANVRGGRRGETTRSGMERGNRTGGHMSGQGGASGRVNAHGNSGAGSHGGAGAAGSGGMQGGGEQR